MGPLQSMEGAWPLDGCDAASHTCGELMFAPEAGRAGLVPRHGKPPISTLGQPVIALRMRIGTAAGLLMPHAPPRPIVPTLLIVSLLEAGPPKFPIAPRHLASSLRPRSVWSGGPGDDLPIREHGDGCRQLKLLEPA